MMSSPSSAERRRWRGGVSRAAAAVAAARRGKIKRGRKWDIYLCGLPAVFFVSVFGLALFNFYKLKIEAAFSFVVAVCEIVTALFAVGCLNLLSVGYYLLAVFSTVCFFYYILRIIMKREKADFFISPAVLFIAAASVLSVVLYHDVNPACPTRYPLAACR